MSKMTQTGSPHGTRRSQPLRPTRRAALGLLGAGALAACGFTPVYAPSGGGSTGGLAGMIRLPPPSDRNTQQFHTRIVDRLGHPGGGAHPLTVSITSERQGLGTTSDGQTTLYQLLGEAEFSLTDGSTGAILSKGKTQAFTSYAATASTVSTLAARRDAETRLMVILADQSIDRMTLDLAARGAQ